MKPKTCFRCKQDKPATADFWHRSSATKDGWQSWCKECRSAYSRERNYDEARKQRRNWKEEYQKAKSRPGFAKQQKSWRKKNADYIKAKGKHVREEQRQELVYRRANASARKRGAQDALRRAHWVAVLMVSEYKCLACGARSGPSQEETLTIDHVVPLIRGEQTQLKTFSRFAFAAT